MTDEQLLNALQHPAFNISWFARKFYEGRRGNIAVMFHNKIRYNEFSKDDFARLRKIFTELAEYPV